MQSYVYISAMPFSANKVLYAFYRKMCFSLNVTKMRLESTETRG